MRSLNAISLLMALLVMGTNFVALCHPVEHRSTAVHLITDTCQSHTCSHDDHTPGCSDAGCSAESCSDESAFSDCIPHDSVDLQLFVQVAMVGMDEFFTLKTPSAQLFFHRAPLRPPAHRMTVLRI